MCKSWGMVITPELTGCVVDTCNTKATVNDNDGAHEVMIVEKLMLYSASTPICVCSNTEANLHGYDVIYVNGKCTAVKTDVGCGDKPHTRARFASHKYK